MKEMKSPYPYTPERKVQIRETDDLIRTQIVYTRQRINTEDLPGSLLAGDLYMLLQFCTKRDRLDYKAMPLTRLREMTDDWENESYYWSADTRAQAEDEVVQLLDGLDCHYSSCATLSRSKGQPCQIGHICSRFGETDAEEREE